MFIMDPSLDSWLDFENSKVQCYSLFLPVCSMKVMNYSVSLQQDIKSTNRFTAGFVTN